MCVSNPVKQMYGCTDEAEDKRRFRQHPTDQGPIMESNKPLTRKCSSPRYKRNKTLRHVSYRKNNQRRVGNQLPNSDLLQHSLNKSTTHSVCV